MKYDLRDELRKRGLSITRPRLAVAELIAATKEPLTAQELSERLRKVCDQATVYRAIRALDRARLIRQVDLRHNHAHYEWSHGADCHHVICSICGLVEHLEQCDMDDLGPSILRKTKGFSKLQEHAVTFYGLCKKCNFSKRS